MSLLLLRCLEGVVLGDVRDADNQDAHPAMCTVDDTAPGGM